MRQCVVAALVACCALLHPAVSAAEPDAEVRSPGAPVRISPHPDAAIIGTLPAGTRVTVDFTQRGPGGDWVQVALPSGEPGFIPDESLRRLTRPPSWRATGRAPVVTGRSGEGLWVRLRQEGKVLLVPARVNGRVVTHFVLDTGASTVTITRHVAAQLGVESQGAARAFLTANGVIHAQPVILDSIQIPDESGAGAAAVEAVIAPLPGFPPAVGGLLGQSFLRHFRVSIDAERLILHLEPAP